MGKLKLLALFLVALLISCTNDKFKIDEIGFTYLKDENGLLYFLAYFQYPKTEQFEASISIKTKDGVYSWKSMCQDFAVYGKSYKVAGRFSLPESLSDCDVDVQVNYKNKSASFEKRIEYPDDKYESGDIEIFALELKKNNQTSYSMIYANSFKSSDEYAYSYMTGNYISSSNVLSSKLQSLKVTSDTLSIHLVEKKSGSDIIYTKTTSL